MRTLERLISRCLHRLAGPWSDGPKLHKDHTRMHRACYWWDSRQYLEWRIFRRWNY